MSLVARATTTTNAHKRRQRNLLSSTYKPTELDMDYLQALKVINEVHHDEEEAEGTSISTKSILRRSDHRKKEAKPRPSYQFSSTLTSVGQEAMIKTYEDTLISHLRSVYPSKRIGTILPRLHTAKFRVQLPNHYNPNHSHDIQHAQILIDNILNQNSRKDDILGDYIKWQQQWTKNAS